MIDNKARWIWINHRPQKNEYARFEEIFSYSGGAVSLSLCAETDYVLSINGAVVSFGQFAGYPTEKYYETVDLTPYCREGENRLSLAVRYEGVNSATHIDDGAGVIYSLTSDGEFLAYSGTHTLGGLHGGYIQHQERNITGQLGLTSGMAAGREFPLSPCVEVAKTRNLKPRPVKKLALGTFLPAIPVEGKPGLYDLGREEAGYLSVTFRVNSPGRATVAYGEHIADGGVRQKVGGRDFSIDFDLIPGEHTFTQYFIRIAGRYLQASLPVGTKVTAIGILPARYPLGEKAFPLTGTDRAIYDTCLRTLRLCMGNHYEDCPWREQGLYVLDARNQMLCGYYAFDDPAYARANLVFMSKGVREDGLLELTYPAVGTPAIPFFSLMYPVAVAEYVIHTGDRSILREVGEVAGRILTIFEAAIDSTGLIPELPPPYWNFYEWSDGSDGWGKPYRPGCHSLILNCAFVHSTHLFETVTGSFDTNRSSKLAEIKKAIVKYFACDDGTFRLFDESGAASSQLGNAMAMLVGLGEERTENAVKHGKNLIPTTLSAAGFVYDALLARSPANAEFVLNDIRQKYKTMLDAGATTFWETLEGQEAFERAGSLCHGWSALPVYYYHRLLNLKNTQETCAATGGCTKGDPL